MTYDEGKKYHVSVKKKLRLLKHGSREYLKSVEYKKEGKTCNKQKLLPACFGWYLEGTIF